MMETGSNRVDALVVAAKGTLGAIPLVGPIIAEVVGAIIPNQRIERIARLLEELRRRVADLDRAVVEQRMKTPEGVDLLEDGFLQAARALSEERIGHIANVLKRGLSEVEAKHAENKMLMQLLAQLTDPEIILLRWLNSSKRDPNFCKRHQAVISTPQARSDLSADEIKQRILYEAREAHLRTLGLLFPRDGTVRYNPNYDRPSHGGASNDVTPLGRLFLHTILPEEHGAANVQGYQA